MDKKRGKKCLRIRSKGAINLINLNDMRVINRVPGVGGGRKLITAFVLSRHNVPWQDTQIY